MTEDQYKQIVKDKEADIEFYTKRNEQLETEMTALKMGARALQDKDAQIDQLKREVNHLRIKIKEQGLDEEKQKMKEFTGSSNYTDETNWP